MREAIDILLEAGLLDAATHERICSSGEFGVWRVLLALEAGLDPEVVAQTLADAFHAPRLEVIRAWPDAGSLAGEKLVKLRYCVPLRITDDARLALAMVDPSDRASIDDVRIVTGLGVRPLTVTVEELEELWQMVYPEPLDLRTKIANLYVGWAGDEAVASRLLNVLLLQTTVKEGALDISWEDEVNVTGLCEKSTREKDRLLAQFMIDRLREMTQSPRPANLGGLVLHTSTGRRPHHLLVRFSARAASVVPVDPEAYSEYFG